MPASKSRRAQVGHSSAVSAGADSKGKSNLPKSKGGSSKNNRSSSKGGSSYQKSSSTFIFLRNNCNCHVPLFIFLAVGAMLPLLLCGLLAWGLSVDNSTEGILRLEQVSDISTEELTFSSLDSIIEVEVEKFVSVYEGAYKIAKAGALVEQRTFHMSYYESKKLMALWTQSLAYPWHYPLVYFAFACNGHIVGSGYDHYTETFTAFYNYLDYYGTYDEDGNAVYKSGNSVVYNYKGCNTPDMFTGTTREILYQTDFNKKDNGWAKILSKENMTNATTSTMFDVRLQGWYEATWTGSNKCHWSTPYVSIQAPFPVTMTIALKSYDLEGAYYGMVAMDFYMDEIQKFVETVNTGYVRSSCVVLDGSFHVLASTAGSAIQQIELGNGDLEVQLLSFYDYAEDVLRKGGSERYLTMARYVDSHPEFKDQLIAQESDISDINREVDAAHFKLYMGNGDPMLVSALHITDACDMDFILLVMMEENELLDTLHGEGKKAEKIIDDGTMYSMIAIFGFCLIGVAAGVASSRAISTPLKMLRQDLIRVQSLDFSGTFDFIKPFIREIQTIRAAYVSLKGCLEHFKCFVPEHIVEELIEQGEAATSREVDSRQVAFLFCDLANFTRAAHSSQPHVVADFANSFLGGTADIISNNGGTVVDFFGDQILGMFNAPHQDPDYGKLAFECATKMLNYFDELKETFAAEHPQFNIVDVRIGLHCGAAMVGKIGSASRLKYCATGDNVALGSRIENINKRYGSRIAASGDIVYQLDKVFRKTYTMRPMESFNVSGRDIPVIIYEVAGVSSDVDKATQDEFAAHTDMFNKIRNKEASEEEVEKFIASHGAAAKFLKSSGKIINL